MLAAHPPEDLLLENDLETKVTGLGCQQKGLATGHLPAMPIFLWSCSAGPADPMTLGPHCSQFP